MRRGGIYDASVVEFDQPSPRGFPFVERLNAFFWAEKTRVPSQQPQAPFMRAYPFGYQETLTVLGQHWRTVPAWAIDGPPVSRPLAPNMRLPMPTQRTTAARAAFDQAMGVTPK